MNPESVFCPNLSCPAKGQRGRGNITIHSARERRYACQVCNKTFCATKGSIFYRLHTDPVTVMLVITLLAFGCPLQAIVVAFGFPEDYQFVMNARSKSGGDGRESTAKKCISI